MNDNLRLSYLSHSATSFDEGKRKDTYHSPAMSNDNTLNGDPITLTIYKLGMLVLPCMPVHAVTGVGQSNTSPIKVAWMIASYH